MADSKTDDHYAECPHCGGMIVVAASSIACRIFRHAAHKTTLEPVNPHATQAELEQLLAAGSIEGCGKPFRYDGTSTSVCGYE